MSDEKPDTRKRLDQATDAQIGIVGISALVLHFGASVALVFLVDAIGVFSFVPAIFDAYEPISTLILVVVSCAYLFVGCVFWMHVVRTISCSRVTHG